MNHEEQMSQLDNPLYRNYMQKVCELPFDEQPKWMKKLEPRQEHIDMLPGLAEHSTSHGTYTRDEFLGMLESDKEFNTMWGENSEMYKS